MRITEKMILDGMMGDIQSHLSDISRMQQQIAAGKRIIQPSDDPLGTSKAISLDSTLQKLKQFKINADESSAWMSNTLSNLAQAQQVVVDLKSNALQGGTDTITPDARVALAANVDSLATQLLKIANSQWNGAYVFSGQRTTTAAFTSDGQYHGDQGALNRVTGPGETVTINFDGQKVFKDEVDIFQVMNELKTALLNNDTSAIQSTVGKLDTALSHVLKLEAVMGSEYQRVQASSIRSEDAQVTIKTMQADNNDIDLPQAVVQLQSLQNIYQAALSTGAKLLQQSLLQYLK